MMNRKVRALTVPHGAEPDPPLMAEWRAQVAAMMPQVDFPELLLEVAARTGFSGELYPHLRRAAAHDGLQHQRVCVAGGFCEP